METSRARDWIPSLHTNYKVYADEESPFEECHKSDLQPTPGWRGIFSVGFFSHVTQEFAVLSPPTRETEVGGGVERD